jgi:hypothetical protein
MLTTGGIYDMEIRLRVRGFADPRASPKPRPLPGSCRENRPTKGAGIGRGAFAMVTGSFRVAVDAAFMHTRFPISSTEALSVWAFGLFILVTGRFAFSPPTSNKGLILKIWNRCAKEKGRLEERPMACLS